MSRGSGSVCCCQWGLMTREDGFPEFPCWDCLEHGGPDSVMGDPNHRCRRHTQQPASQPGPLDLEALRALIPPTHEEIEEAIASIQKDAS